MSYYLRVGNDDLDAAERHATKADALAAYGEVARELARYDQRIEATVHIAPNRREIAEYPDFYLTLGPRGGIRCDRC